MRVKGLCKLWCQINVNVKRKRIMSQLGLWGQVLGLSHLWIPTMSSSVIHIIDGQVIICRSYGCPAFECLYHIWGLPHQESGEQSLPPRREDVSVGSISLTTPAALEQPMHLCFIHQINLPRLWTQRQWCWKAGTIEPPGTAVAAARWNRRLCLQAAPSIQPQWTNVASWSV